MPRAVGSAGTVVLGVGAAVATVAVAGVALGVPKRLKSYREQLQLLKEVRRAVRLLRLRFRAHTRPLLPLLSCAAT